ncbi:MAG: hypothetical protein M0R40_09745 [Firmicutes bacterium]|nr:hypothetical protein [Bacillota bacterium]
MLTKTVNKSQAIPQTVNAIKKLAVQAKVMRYTTDALGTILANAAVPVADRKPYPFHLFGDFDRNGGYQIADQITQRFNTNLYAVYVVGNNTPFFNFLPIQTIQNVVRKGDIVFMYVNDVLAPTIFTFIVITTVNRGGFASLVAQSNISQIGDKGYWGVMNFDGIRYKWSDDAQLEHPLYLITTEYTGDFKFNVFNPLSYWNPDQKNEVKQLVLPLSMNVNQYAGISSFLDFDNLSLELLFEFYY